MADKDTWLALERRFWEAMKDRDGSSAMELSDDPTVVVGAQGAREIPRTTLGAMLEAPAWRLLSYKVEDFIAREAAPGVVITAYRITEELSVDEKPLTLEAYDSSVWVERDGKWVCSLHTESPAGDPFGRDKTKG
jgi:hypothetical protein